MKRLALSLGALLFLMDMNAQIVTSRSVSTITTPKTPSKTTWVFRVGVGSNNFSGNDYEDVDSKFGYQIGLEFNKPIKDKGAYWGMGFNLGSRGYSVKDYDDFSYTAHNFQWSPFTFGWKIDIIDEFRIDPHIGCFVSADYFGKYKWDDEDESIYDAEDYKYFDAGMNIGVGFWYKRFNLDLLYQKGFMSEFKDGEGGASNFLVRLGVAF